MSELANSVRTTWGLNRPKGPSDRVSLRLSGLQQPLVLEKWSREETFSNFPIFIEYIRHENDLLNHRTTWFVAVQAALAAGIGFLFYNKAIDVASTMAGCFIKFNWSAAHILSMWSLICLIGIATSSAARRSVDAALYAQDTLDLLWRHHANPQIAAMLPDMMGGKGSYASESGGSFAMDLPTMSLDLWKFLILLPMGSYVLKLFSLRYIHYC